MQIRPADLADVEAILLMEHGYETDHVWQMSGGTSNTEQTAAFHLSKLPRKIQVAYPHEPRTLRRVLHKCDRLWVMQGTTSRELLGYVGMASVPWQNTAWIPALAVAPAERRKGVATQMLRTAINQAKADGVHSVTLDVPTKNYPATRLALARGFVFSGYADNYYASRDIALFFAYRIR